LAATTVDFHDDYGGLFFRLSRFRHSATKATKAASEGGGWRRLG
jgi:hypothetical protein